MFQSTAGVCHCGGHVEAARTLLGAGAAIAGALNTIDFTRVSIPTDPVGFDDLVSELCDHPPISPCAAVLPGVRLRVPKVVETFAVATAAALRQSFRRH